jgi:tetratricopeptide (TPR) repeat protein
LIDREAIDELHAKMTILQSEINMSDRAYILAALFCWHASKHSEARTYAKKALDMNPNSGQAFAILGWLDLKSDNSSIAAKSHTFFDKAIERNARDLEVGRVFE